MYTNGKNRLSIICTSTVNDFAKAEVRAVDMDRIAFKTLHGVDTPSCRPQQQSTIRTDLGICKEYKCGSKQHLATLVGWFSMDVSAA